MEKKKTNADPWLGNLSFHRIYRACNSVPRKPNQVEFLQKMVRIKKDV
jgi:hypothetical protein